jgi:hypothetical protein
MVDYTDSPGSLLLWAQNCGVSAFRNARQPMLREYKSAAKTESAAITRIKKSL